MRFYNSSDTDYKLLTDIIVIEKEDLAKGGAEWLARQFRFKRPSHLYMHMDCTMFLFSSDFRTVLNSIVVMGKIPKCKISTIDNDEMGLLLTSLENRPYVLREPGKPKVINAKFLGD
jgi:hypothetical protein